MYSYCTRVTNHPHFPKTEVVPGCWTVSAKSENSWINQDEVATLHFAYLESEAQDSLMLPRIIDRAGIFAHSLSDSK